MDNLCHLTCIHAKTIALRLFTENAGQLSQPFVFSLSGLGMAAFASFLLLDAGLDVGSPLFVERVLKALSIL